MTSRSFIEQTLRIEFDDFPGGPNRSCVRSDRVALMVRDGACAPPHHEDLV